MKKEIAAALFSVGLLAGGGHAAEVFVTVTQNSTFEPAVVTVRPGDTVTWTYAGGGMPHDVHADDNSYFNTASGGPWTFSHVFPAATTSRYYCTLHGAPGGNGMSGMVIVESRAAWAPNDIVQTIGAYDFTYDGAPSGPDLAGGQRGGLGTYFSGVDLPSGALLTGFELSACRFSNTTSVDARLMACPGRDLPCVTLADITSPIPLGTCQYVSVPITGATVDNLANTYNAFVILGGSGNSPIFRAVRVLYRKQVSPAPATATFTDVPTTDPRFRFVEALARAGITGGCGPGLFCPDASLTRGQMAVFLSVALGLHFPN